LSDSQQLTEVYSQTSSSFAPKFQTGKKELENFTGGLDATSMIQKYSEKDLFFNTDLIV